MNYEIKLGDSLEVLKAMNGKPSSVADISKALKGMMA